ncbi:MAG: riboflavin biosynthesis protein RibF [Bacteroidota bacterium]
MAELISLQQIRCVPNSVVTVGTFDGVHEGHKVLMRTVVEKAKARKARSVVVTFDPHPRDIINPGKEGIRLLTTLEERAEILADLGIDVLCVVPFNRDFSLLTSEAFLRSIIVDRIGVSEFVIGYDHQFGRDRTGTIDTVLAVGEELGFNATVVSKQEMGAATISSSAVRRALAEAGDVQQAAQFLGRPYRLTGLVMHGDERGRIIGFPTANLDPINKRKIIPRKGVYAVWVWIQETRFRGMLKQVRIRRMTSKST